MNSKIKLIHMLIEWVIGFETMTVSMCSSRTEPKSEKHMSQSDITMETHDRATLQMWDLLIITIIGDLETFMVKRIDQLLIHIIS